MARFLMPRRSNVVRLRCTLEELLPPEHLARFIWKTLEAIDFGALESAYPSITGGPGRSPYHPRLVAALWIYGMTQGMETAAEIAEACLLREDFQWIAGGLRPSDQTLLNLLRHGDRLVSVWAALLKAMHAEGLIDLSMIAEDGSKLRANAGPQSFRPKEDLERVLGAIRDELGEKMRLMSEHPEPGARARRQLHGVSGRLQRVEAALKELERRLERRERRSTSDAPAAPSVAATSAGTPNASRLPVIRDRKDPVFDRSRFVRPPDRDVLICPASQELRLIGTYEEGAHSRYRLYGRRDCGGCDLRSGCTTGQGRRVKIPAALARSPAPEAHAPVKTAPVPEPEATEPAVAARTDKAPNPRASLTDPEALMMLATSEKRWQPSFNADIAVDRNGIIVSQFLTKHPTDYHAFAPALRFVTSTIGQPQAWVGDGHYDTHANLILAAEHGVHLFAGALTEDPASPDDTVDGSPKSNPGGPEQVVDGKEADARPALRFRAADFAHDPEHDVLACPGGHHLQFIGVYPTDNGASTYRLYGRRNCDACEMKPLCTTGRGRRVKRLEHSPPRAPRTERTPDEAEKLPHLIRLRDERLRERGEETRKFRSSTVEPVHAQLKQHGLGHLHVRGLARCGAVLTLSCLAHNFAKWHRKEAVMSMKLAS